VARENPVPRPTAKSEYKIFFGSRKAEKAWGDLVAVRRTDLIKAWEYLAQSPLQSSNQAGPMKDELRFVHFEGKLHERWQLKPSLTAGARIWYFVYEGQVIIERVFTAHPNQTKK
jgi:hypothetical protein